LERQGRMSAPPGDRGQLDFLQHVQRIFDARGTAQLGEDDLAGVEFAGCLDEFFVEGREPFRAGAAGQVQGIGEVDAALVPFEGQADAPRVLG